MTNMIRGKHVDDLFNGYVLLEKAMKLPKFRFDLKYDEKILIYHTYLAFKKIYEQNPEMVKTPVFLEQVNGMLGLLAYHKSHSERIHELILAMQKDAGVGLEEEVQYDEEGMNYFADLREVQKNYRPIRCVHAACNGKRN